MSRLIRLSIHSLPFALDHAYEVRIVILGVDIDHKTGFHAQVAAEAPV
jgi:hypothetical protein